MSTKKRGLRNWKKVELVLSLILFFLLSSFLVVSQTQTYEVSKNVISEKIKFGDFREVPIQISNFRSTPLSVVFNLEGGVSQITSLSKGSVTIPPDGVEELIVRFFAENVSITVGTLLLSGDITESIPINITITDRQGAPVEALLIEVQPITERAKIGDIFDFKVTIQNLLSDQNYNVDLTYSIDRLGEDSTYKFEKSFFEESESVFLETSQTMIKNFDMPDFIRPGTYVINVEASYLGLKSSASRTFRVVEPLLDHLILGILPVRWVLFASFFIAAALGGFIYYRRRKAKQKRYTVKVDYNLLPKPGPRSIFLGYIAETKVKAYFDLEAFTTHTLIAGSTGGGKTVSAEVIIEEALEKGIAVIVFDPTAQWSGFLRRNKEKKMFALYRKFGMKKADAKAFNGNVRQIMNAREIIDIKKYLKPGEINVFTINRLDPEDADVLVANTIREVFHANFPESPQLKLMVIFDEVHRLLPKFGGSGQGFVQIERGAREFRKWGVGLMLISQVLKDFVGETKANINTEVQMRTRDQGDLDRIKEKYGGYMLQSLLKSATGTGMLENAQFNKGNPYFVSFRPLRHMHARLTDEELEKYNKYNDLLDDLEFEIGELSKLKVDVFDLKLEHKMALDKVKSGSFNMVDIYLEGLKPRLKGQWEKLGKKAPKRKKRMVTESELMEEFQKAQAARKTFEETAKKQGIAVTAEGGAAPLKMGDGMYMVTSKTELLDALNAMDDATFGKHVNAKKNEIATWLQSVDQKLAPKAKAAKTRQEMIKVIDEAIPKN